MGTPTNRRLTSMIGRNRRAAATLAALATGFAVAGCGEISNTFNPNPGTADTVKVMLAGPPNAFYVGLYEAQALGYFKQTDINLQIEVPSPGQDPVQLLHDGDLTVAFASLPTVLLHRNENQPVVGIAAVVDAPLTAIRASVGQATTGPCSNTGSGGAGLTTTAAAGPSPTTAATSTTAAGTTTSTTAAGTATTATNAGACATTPNATTTLTTSVGTSTATDTSTTGAGARTAVAVTTLTGSEPDSDLWPAQLRKLIKGPAVPGYDGLNVVARKGSIVDDAPLLRRFVQALARGYRAARADPAGAVQNLIGQVPSLASTQVQQLAIVQAAMPYFFPSTGQIWGWQAPTLWNMFGTWMTTNHVISNPNALTDASTNELLQGEGV